MTEIKKPQKFLFDLSFDEELEGAAEREPTYSQEQLDEAKREAHQAGYDEGLAAAKAAIERQVADTMDVVGHKLDALTKESSAVWQSQLEHLQQVALVIARKVLPAYVEKYGVDEVQTIVSRILSDMSREPRLVIRVAESHFDDVKSRVDALAEKQAFAGEIVILGDPSFGVSDCRIEWANGGVERDLKAIWQQIDKVLEEIQGADTLPLMTADKEEAPEIKPEQEDAPAQEEQAAAEGETQSQTQVEEESTGDEK